MSPNRIERKLADLSDCLRQLRIDVSINAQQLEQFVSEADDARLRALVSETPVAVHEHREAQRHADVYVRRQAEMTQEIERLERRQDELLDELAANVGRA